MDVKSAIEQTLLDALHQTTSPDCPPRMAQAVRYAVFPGGARIRPRLSLAVAHACGCDAPPVALIAASAIELLHCASLVHDDMPCFDDASIRRGKPSVHKAFGEDLALLVGDALIVTAFESLGRIAVHTPQRLPELLRVIAQGVGMPAGIVAGQAWECEPRAVLSEYQRAKTGALFAAASTAGAVASGVAGEPWRALGLRLGEAYQVADDIRDVVADAETLGKPSGQDEALDRPSVARTLGIDGAIKHLEGILFGALDSIPLCAGRDSLRTQILAELDQVLPESLRQAA